MTKLSKELAELAPVTAAEMALLRMPRSERLPKYKRNSLRVGEDCSIEVKNLIRSNGLPKA